MEAFGTMSDTGIKRSELFVVIAALFAVPWRSLQNEYHVFILETAKAIICLTWGSVFYWALVNYRGGDH